MITIKESGKISIPQEDGFIGYAGDNLNKTIEFTLLNRADENLIYRLYLEFDDSTVNFFILDKKIQNNSTMLIWSVTQEHIYKDGIVNMQIKAFNTSGEVFHTDSTPLFVGKSIEFCNYLAEKKASEFLETEQGLNKLYTDIENAKEFLPCIGNNGNWLVYDYASKKYTDSGVSARATVNGLNIAEEINSSSDESHIPTARAVYSFTDSLGNEINTKIGSLSYLITEDKSSLVNAVNELDSDLSAVRGQAETNTASISNKLDNAESVIQSRHIAAGAVGSAQIVGGAVISSKIGNGAVTADKISSNAVTTEKISDGNVTTDKLADESVSENKLKNLSVTSAKLGANSVVTSKIADNSITPAKIKSDYLVTDLSGFVENVMSGHLITAGAVYAAINTAISNIADGTEVSY